MNIDELSKNLSKLQEADVIDWQDKLDRKKKAERLSQYRNDASKLLLDVASKIDELQEQIDLVGDDLRILDAYSNAPQDHLLEKKTKELINMLENVTKKAEKLTMFIDGIKF